MVSCGKHEGVVSNKLAWKTYRCNDTLELRTFSCESWLWIFVCFGMQMDARDLLAELPTEILCKIIYLLPILERARLEAVAKQLLHLSKQDVSSLRFKFISELDYTGLELWLDTLSKTPSRLSLHRLEILPGLKSQANSRKGKIFEQYCSLCRDCISVVPFVSCSSNDCTVIARSSCYVSGRICNLWIKLKVTGIWVLLHYS